MAYDVEVAERLREELAGEPGVSERPMFGGLAFLINGNLAVSASGQGGLLLRVDPSQTEKLVAEPQARPFVMRGRELAGWLHIAASVLDSDSDFSRWVALGVAQARSLPPK
jgi:TfoX/Sxy family transcriptional regulator of competence genes